MDLGKGVIRAAKNYTKGYSDTQTKVRVATSNDQWPPSSTQLHEIAQLTYIQSDFIEVIEMLENRLNDKGKNWRHVFKALIVLDYCIKSGSEKVILYFQDNLHLIKTLKEFQYIDENGRDQGTNVRQKANELTRLLMEDLRPRTRRSARVGRGVRAREIISDRDRHTDDERRRPSSSSARIDVDVKRLPAREIAEQKAEAELARAQKLKEEEEERKRKVIEANAAALFDDRHQLPPPMVQGVQPQLTSLYAMQQQVIQSELTRQQQEWQRLHLQQEELLRQRRLLEMQQQQNMIEAQRQELEARQQQLQKHAQLLSQPTGLGSNNPFAPRSTSTPPPLRPMSPASFQTQMSKPVEFNLPGTFASAPRSTTPPPPTVRPQTPPIGPPKSSTPRVRLPNQADEEHSQLAYYLSERDGMDTFGNTGSLRYGHNDAGRLISQASGNTNPFTVEKERSVAPFFDV